MIAAKHHLNPILFHHTVSGLGMVSRQLFSYGWYRFALRSQVWDQSTVGLDVRLKCLYSFGRSSPKSEIFFVSRITSFMTGLTGPAILHYGSADQAMLDTDFRYHVADHFRDSPIRTLVSSFDAETLALLTKVYRLQRSTGLLTGCIAARRSVSSTCHALAQPCLSTAG